MTTATRQTAKSLFLTLTGDSGSIDRLWGPANAPNRAAILSVLIGKKIAKSNPQAGWNRFRRAMLNLFDIDTQGLCIAQEDDALRDAATQSPETEAELVFDLNYGGGRTEKLTVPVNSRPTPPLVEVSGPAGLPILVPTPLAK